MKHKFGILVLSTLLCASSIGATVVPTEITQIKIEPLSLFYEETTIQITGTASRTNTLTFLILIYNDIYPDGKILFESKFTSASTKTFVYDNNLTRGSNQIGVEWWTSKKKTKSLIKTYVDTSNPRTVRVNDSPFDYTSECKYSNYLSISGWEQVSEKLTFKNFNSQYVPDFYHKVDLSNFKISCSTGFDTALTMRDGYLSVTNLNGIFDDLEQSGKNAIIPLGLKKSNDQYVLCFLNDMYVDQLTLRMSSNPKPGYVKTQYLYLPRNEKRNENEFEFNIKLNDFGMERNNYVGTFRYKSILNTLGDCHNSQYCVVNA